MSPEADEDTPLLSEDSKVQNPAVPQCSVNQPPERQSLDTFIDEIGFGGFQVKISLLTGLAWMADAVEMMILSILSPALQHDWDLTSVEQAFITTVVFSGMMISSVVWGTICDRWGRKFELILCSLFTFYYGLLSAISPVYIWMLVLRGMVGFGIGGAPQSMVLYSEFLPTKHRAKCIIMIESFWAIGNVLEVMLALFIMPTLGWRYLLAASASPLLVFLLFTFWLPESPRFDIARGRPELAVKTLKRVAKGNQNVTPVAQLDDMDPRDVFVADKAEKRGNILDLLVPEYRRTTLLLWFIWLSSAFSYYGIILMTTELFVNNDACGRRNGTAPAEPPCPLEAKVLSKGDYIDLLWTALAEFPGLLITVVVIEYVGRRFTLAIEFVGFAAFVLLLNICVQREVMTFFLFAGRALATGALQAAYVYTPEVYPTSIRAIGVGSCSSCARIGAMITPFIAQVILRYSSALALSLYAGTCLMAAVAAALLPIETKGRQMTEAPRANSAGTDSTDSYAYKRLHK